MWKKMLHNILKSHIILIHPASTELPGRPSSHATMKAATTARYVRFDRNQTSYVFKLESWVIKNPPRVLIIQYECTLAFNTFEICTDSYSSPTSAHLNNAIKLSSIIIIAPPFLPILLLGTRFSIRTSSPQHRRTSDLR